MRYIILALVVVIATIYYYNKPSSIDNKVQVLLEKSKYAKYDYVSSIDFDGLSYEKIPFLDCLPDFIISTYQEKDCQDPSKQKYIDSFQYPDIKLKKTSRNTYKVKISKNINRIFTIKGYRDINGDGYMDIILVVSELDSNTILTRGVVVLTKLKKHSSSIKIVHSL